MSALTYEKMLAMLGSRLTGAAVEHSVRVAETATELARVYLVDSDDARIAGLLHDWDRETGDDALLARAADAGLPVSEADRAVPYLLHGPVAACELGAIVEDLSEDVLSAIAAHTYGSVEMTPLAKLVYVADVIEPERGHESVRALREAAGAVSLDELFARAYVASLVHVVETRRTMHPVTLRVYNRHVARVRS